MNCQRHTEIRVACLCYQFDTSFAVSRLLPLTQTPDLSSCLTQCGVCSWTRRDLRNKRVPSKHIYMDTCLYIMCVSVLCRERTTVFLDTKAYARTLTHWAIPDRLVMFYVTPLPKTIRFSSQWTSADRSNATQTTPYEPTESVLLSTVTLCGSPCPDEAVHLEGLTECHLHVLHTQRSWPQIFTPPGWIGNCNQFLFLFFTQEIIRWWFSHSSRTVGQLSTHKYIVNALMISQMQWHPAESYCCVLTHEKSIV